AVAGLRREEFQLSGGVKGLPGALFQLGLVVPSIHMADATRAKNLDDRLGLWRVVGWTRRQRIVRHGGVRGRAKVAAIVEQRRQRDTAQAAAEFPEKLAAGSGVDCVSGTIIILGH